MSDPMGEVGGTWTPDVYCGLCGSRELGAGGMIEHFDGCPGAGDYDCVPLTEARVIELINAELDKRGFKER